MIARTNIRLAVWAVALGAAVPAAFGGSARYVEGWPVSVASVHGSSPVVADVDGDNLREIAVVTWNGQLSLFDARGRLRPGFPVRSGASGERSSPALADINGDKRLEVIFGSADGNLYAFDDRGRVVPGWPRPLSGESVAGPAVQDFTSYRGLEVFAAAGAAVYGFHGNGSAVGGWPVSLAAAATTAPAVGDLDGDRQPEVVVAAGNEVYAFSTSGAAAPGWPAVLDGAAAGPPVLADIDGDGRTEVVIGTAAGSAYVLEFDGTVRAGWPRTVASKPITTPAAVGDVDGEGELAVVFVAGGPHIRGATVAVFEPSGRPKSGFPKELGQTVAAAPLVADVDGDGVPEVVLVSYTGSLVAFERNGALAAGFPIKLRGSGITATPAATDVDNDGFLDIVVASQEGQLEVVATDGTYEAGANPWPMFAGNCWRNGKYLPPAENRRTFTLTARGGEVVVRWRAEPREGRSGWAILKGVKDAGGGGVNYVELATVDDGNSPSYTYRDAAVEGGVIYYYKIEERLLSGAVNTYGPKAIRAVGGGAAKAASTLGRCSPNPFAVQLHIAYELVSPEGEAVDAEVAVYDISGKLVRRLVREKKAPGNYIAIWDGTGPGGAPVANGVYLVSLRAGRNTPASTKSVVLVR